MSDNYDGPALADYCGRLQSRITDLEKDRDAMRSKIHSVCKAWAIARKSWDCDVPELMALADRIIEAERAARNA